MRPAAAIGRKRLAARIETDPSVEILTGTSHASHIFHILRHWFAESRRATTLS
jgi:hypothetical protein